MPQEWIDAMADDECVEVFRLYADAADALLDRYGAARIAQAVRWALRRVATAEHSGATLPPAGDSKGRSPQRPGHSRAE